MKKFSRLFLFGAFALILLTAGCAGDEGQQGTPSVVDTLQPGELTASPSPMATEVAGTAETETPSTPATVEATSTPTPTAAAQETPVTTVTVADIRIVECQFCIDTMAYALLDIPAIATFEIVAPAPPAADTVCNVADTFNDRPVILCRAPEASSITVNICTDSNTCSETIVDLQPCPVAATAQPGGANTATPTSSTGATATATPTAGASPTAGGPTTTPTPTP